MKNKEGFLPGNGPSILAVVFLLAAWEAVCILGLVPPFMIPSPIAVCRAMIKDAPLLFGHALVTLKEAFLGLFAGVFLGVIFAILMDGFEVIKKSLYPILVITQTIPTVAIAPLLVLWFGYEMLPKIVLIVLVTFFPVTVGVLGGLEGIDPDKILLFRSMGAGSLKTLWYLKCPSVLPEFFAALRIAAAYSVVGAVIAEWLGGFWGLGVYMIRVKEAFATDKMFAVIIIISVVSLLLMWIVDLLQRICMPYLYQTEEL